MPTSGHRWVIGKFRLLSSDGGAKIDWIERESNRVPPCVLGHSSSIPWILL